MSVESNWGVGANRDELIHEKDWSLLPRAMANVEGVYYIKAAQTRQARQAKTHPSFITGADSAHLGRPVQAAHAPVTREEFKQFEARVAALEMSRNKDM